MFENVLMFERHGCEFWKDAPERAESDVGNYRITTPGEIAERLCTPSELKKTRGGEWRPNSREEWLDVQARALYQAARRVKEAARKTAC